MGAGIFLLKQVDNFLSSLREKAHAELCRDYGLIYIENANGPLLNKVEMALHRISKSNSLKISIEQKGHSVNFLDVTLETDGSYKPYRKPNGITKYVNKASNHPHPFSRTFLHQSKGDSTPSPVLRICLVVLRTNTRKP